MNSYLYYLLGFSFAVLVACLIVVLISGIFLFFISQQRINDTLEHPYLKARAFKHQPASIKLAITLDYFLHLMFPKVKGPGLIGNANRMLDHVDIRVMPLGVRMPIAGFWGCCFVGIVAMLMVWILTFMGVAG